MYYQTKLTPPREDSDNPLAGGVREFTHDVITLAELQGELFLTDLRASRVRLMRSALLLGVAPVAGLAGLIVLLLGGGRLIAESFDWNASVVHVVLAVTAIIAAGACGRFGWKALERSVTVFARSHNELSENITWLKQVLRSGASGRRPLPRRSRW